MTTLRVVCYVNQFFGQLGGEEKAGVGPDVVAGAVGAARAVQQALIDAGTRGSVPRTAAPAAGPPASAVRPEASAAGRVPPAAGTVPLAAGMVRPAGGAVPLAAGTVCPSTGTVPPAAGAMHLAAGTVVATVRCGDNYVAEHEAQAVAELLALVREHAPDLVIAGPAFQAGRYGVACGALCHAVQRELGIPAITGMHEENPGVDLYRRHVYILRTGGDPARMLEEARRVVALGLKLARREPIGEPVAEGYFPRGITRNVVAEESAARRATAMLLAKLAGEPVTSEVPLPSFVPVPPPRGVRDVRRATIALVTDGGIVPRGNPDGIEPLAATRYGSYSIAGVRALDPSQYDNPHRGYDTTYVKQDPHRLVPVDVARELEAAGAVGALHEVVYSTVGVATTLAESQRMGREIAAKLKAAGVDGVILTST